MDKSRISCEVAHPLRHGLAARPHLWGPLVHAQQRSGHGRPRLAAAAAALARARALRLAAAGAAARFGARRAGVIVRAPAARRLLLQRMRARLFQQAAFAAQRITSLDLHVRREAIAM